ncbi:hypothetical protein [Eubacterium sp.]|uniref:hypothetical protein n=1 Tax=Eubacterium sp. TaxID=142586 RepID=UPI0035228DED
MKTLRAAMEKYNNVVIAVSEGIKRCRRASTLVPQQQWKIHLDTASLSGTGKCLEYIIKQNLQVKVRSVEINILAKKRRTYVIYYRYRRSIQTWADTLVEYCH